MCAVLPTTRRTIPAPEWPVILTRELLAAGSATILAGQEEPGVQVRSDAERKASLARFMKNRPTGDLWIFAIRSLVWNPTLPVAERRVAEVRGWHRSFCLSMAVGRGTPFNPGLVLGLDQGGACEGVAYRIAEQDVASELPILWNREMLIGGYDPTWVDVIGEDDEKFGAAIAFTIDQDHEHYAGALRRDEKIRRLATAKGSWGSSAEYLFRTIGGLREHGICDVEIERLGDLVSSITLEEPDGIG
jgi:cation transport protein ChaC